MIPFNKPYLTGRELQYVQESLASARLSGDGPFTKRCTERLQSILGGAPALLTTSCTHALEMSALLLDLKPGDEVILPSFTFVSTANAFVLRGAKPVFVDIRPDTLNIDERLIEEKITPRTRAICVVHYAGFGCAMEPILEIARRHRLAVVEDAAHAVGAALNGKPLGTFGDLAALSFHETKNVVSGEGGALVINTPGLVERAEIIREKGTDRTKFMRGQVDKYTWVDVGSSYLPSDVLAALLLAQLESLEEINTRRRAIFDAYHRGLEVAEERGALRRPIVPPGCGGNGHLYYVLLPTPEKRDRVLSGMQARGILCVFHYLPLHLSPVGRTYGYREGDLPVTERTSPTILRLPLYGGMTDAEVETVIERLLALALRS